jgi:hypothetical protein
MRNGGSPNSTATRSCVALDRRPWQPKTVYARPRRHPKLWCKKPLLTEKTQYIVLDVCTAAEFLMSNTEHENLLRSARSLLDRFMFEGDEIRADPVDLCMKIDDALPALAEGSVSQVTPDEMVNVSA